METIISHQTRSIVPSSRYILKKSLDLIGLDSGTGRDGKFQFMPESYNYGYKNLLTYDEFYYRDYRTQKMLVDTETGETMEWKSDDEDALREFLQTYPTVTIIDQEIPTVKLAIVVQGKGNVSWARILWALIIILLFPCWLIIIPRCRTSMAHSRRS